MRNDLQTVDAVINILMDWADWQKGYAIDLGFKHRSLCLSSGYAASTTFDDMYDESISQRCLLVDTCVDDLPQQQRNAIHHRYLATVLRMRDYEQNLADAHVELTRTFILKGVLT